MARKQAPRRRDAETTKAAILTAARERFAADGYERATIRAIAGDAAIDPALALRLRAVPAAVRRDEPHRARRVGRTHHSALHQLAGAVSPVHHSQDLIRGRNLLARRRFMLGERSVHEPTAPAWRACA